jgi:AGZA family xanthine/uracil permease-like MFS transporter
MSVYLSFWGPSLAGRNIGHQSVPSLYCTFLEMTGPTDLHSEEIEMRSVNQGQGASGEMQTSCPSWFHRLGKSLSNVVQRVDNSASKSLVGRLFQLKGSGHVCSHQTIRRVTHSLTILPLSQPKEIADARLSTEIRAGLTTFATMAYIVAVNV